MKPITPVWSAYDEYANGKSYDHDEIKYVKFADNKDVLHAMYMVDMYNRDARYLSGCLYTPMSVSRIDIWEML